MPINYSSIVWRILSSLEAGNYSGKLGKIALRVTNWVNPSGSVWPSCPFCGLSLSEEGENDLTRRSCDVIRDEIVTSARAPSTCNIATDETIAWPFMSSRAVNATDAPLFNAVSVKSLMSLLYLAWIVVWIRSLNHCTYGSYCVKTLIYLQFAAAIRGRLWVRLKRKYNLIFKLGKFIKGVIWNDRADGQCFVST